MKACPRCVLTAALAVGLIAAACGPKADRSAPGKGSGRPEIAVIPKGTTHEFWKAIHLGALTAAEELGVDIIWKGPQKEDDRAQQITVVEDFVSRGVSGIVLAPLDERALHRPVQDAVRERIPVVVIDSSLEGDDHVSYVATDNTRGGVLAARQLASILGGKGRIFLIRYQVGSASTMQREAGFLETITAEAPGIEILVQDLYAGATTESAYQLAENLLSRFRDVDGIFTPNESSTFGMLRALQQEGLAGKIAFVGFDASPKLVQGLRDGQINALILQNPVKIGYLGVKQLVLHLRGVAIDKVVDTGVQVATPRNMDDPEIKSLLSPDFSKFPNI